MVARDATAAPAGAELSEGLVVEEIHVFVSREITREFSIRWRTTGDWWLRSLVPNCVYTLLFLSHFAEERRERLSLFVTVLLLSPFALVPLGVGGGGRIPIGQDPPDRWTLIARERI